jgi:hypothetical protein
MKNPMASAFQDLPCPSGHRHVIKGEMLTGYCALPYSGGIEGVGTPDGTSPVWGWEWRRGALGEHDG